MQIRRHLALHRAAVVALFAAALAWPGGGAVAETGTMILDGGGVSSYLIFDRIAAEVPDGGTLCLVDTAAGNAGDPQAFFAPYPGLRLAMVDIDAAAARRPDTAARLGDCDGFFFNGGDPQALSDAFVDGGRGTPALNAVREAVMQRGVMFSGSSAGAMVVGSTTLCECGAQSSVIALTEDRLFQAPGFGFVDGVLVDAHFFARGLLGRHLFALARNGIRTGIGIDESTAVVVPRGGGLWEVAGDGPVALIYAPREARTEQLTGFSFSLLAPGDRFDPRTGAVQVADARVPLPVRRDSEAQPLLFQDIFAPGRVRMVVEQLVQAPTAGATAFAEGGGIRVTLEKTERTQAFSDGRSFTVLGLRVSIDHPRA